MSLFPVIFLAIAVSLDGLGAGLACGLKGVGIPFLSLVLMGVAAGSAVLISMATATFLGSFITPQLAGLVGGLLLMGLGLFMLAPPRGGGGGEGFFALRHDPTRADADSSGSIRGKEAMVLGLALALDGFGAGFGGGFAGLSLGVTGLAVSLANIVFISVGLRLGRLASALAPKSLLILPGLIIFSLGLVKIIML